MGGGVGGGVGRMVHCNSYSDDQYDCSCQGYSLQLTGTRGLVGEGGVEGVVDAFRG